MNIHNKVKQILAYRANNKEIQFLNSTSFYIHKPRCSPVKLTIYAYSDVQHT